MTLELRINGKTFPFWKEATVTRAVTQFCHDFQFTAPDAFASNGAWSDIVPTDEIEIVANGEQILAGYIDGVDIEQSKDGTTLRYFGCSMTGDVYDCSATKASHRFSKRTPGAIARELCAVVGVDVDIQKDGPIIRDFAITPGETIYECITRACATYGIQVLTDELGRVVLHKSVKDIVPTLKITRNTRGIVSRSRSIDYSQRFSEVKVLSQSGGSSLTGEQSAAKFASATVRDNVMPRTRKLIVNAEEQMTSQQLQLRAQYERNARIGESDSITYTFAGFVDELGGLFSPFVAVDVDDVLVRAQSVYVTDSVVFDASADGGSTTTITLVPPQAFGFEPVVQRKKSGSGGSLSAELLSRLNKFIKENAKITADGEKTR